jgi:hypothetical protein
MAPRAHWKGFLRATGSAVELAPGVFSPSYQQHRFGSGNEIGPHLGPLLFALVFIGLVLDLMD